MSNVVSNYSDQFKFVKLDFWVATIVALISIVFYAFNLTPSLSGGDNGELTTAMHFLGIAHAPGYPLHTFLGKLSTFIPFENVAWRANFFSAISTGVVLYFCMLVYIKLLLTFKVRRSYIYCISIITTVAYGLSEVLWNQSIMCEVYTISAIFHPLTFLILIKWREKIIDNKGSRFVYLGESQLLAYAFIFGVALCSHQTIILTVPFAVFFILLTLYEYQLKGRELWNQKMLLGVVTLVVVLILVAISWNTYFSKIADLKSNLFQNNYKNTKFGVSVFVICQLIMLGIYLIFKFTKKINSEDFYQRGALLLVKFFGMLFIGFCIYLYVFIRAEGNPPINWGGINEIKANSFMEMVWGKLAKFFTMINRKQFGDSGKVAVNLYNFFYTIKIVMIKINGSQFSIPFYFVMLFGLIRLFKDTFWFLSWLVMFLTFNVALSLFLRFNFNPRDLFFVQFFYVFSFFTMTIPLCFGITWIMERVEKIISKDKKNNSDSSEEVEDNKIQSTAEKDVSAPSN